MLEFVTAIIKEEGTEPLLEWRDQSCEASQDSHEYTDPAPEPPNPAPEPPKQAQPPKPTCENKGSDDGDVPAPVAVSPKNAAVVQWTRGVIFWRVFCQ
jgi:hypothetical protein